jgi:hypothetical protein
MDKRGEALFRAGDDVWRAIPVLNVGGMRDRAQHIALGIGEDMALAALDLLARIIAALLPVNLLHRRPFRGVRITLRDSRTLASVAVMLAVDLNITIATAITDASIPVTVGVLKLTRTEPDSRLATSKSTYLALRHGKNRSRS